MFVALVITITGPKLAAVRAGATGCVSSVNGRARVGSDHLRERACHRPPVDREARLGGRERRPARSRTDHRGIHGRPVVSMGELLDDARDLRLRRVRRECDPARRSRRECGGDGVVDARPGAECLGREECRVPVVGDAHGALERCFDMGTGRFGAQPSDGDTADANAHRDRPRGRRSGRSRTSEAGCHGD